MPEEFKYQDKKVGKDVNDEGSLQNLVNKEFKKIENKNGIGYRDDQEIRNAGWNVCDTLINQIKKDKTMVYGPWALQPLTNLANTLKREHNAMKGMKLFTNNVDKINQIANRIDNAEKETLIRLQKNRTTQDSRDVVKKSEEKDKKNPMFTMELDNANKETGNIVFTKASNPVKIHTALEGLFDNTDKVYQIDYSNCTNQKIKSKMTELIGSQTCYLRYDKGQKTYTIRDKDGNGIYNRALIREGVKLIPDGVRKWGAYQEQKKIEENMGKEDMKDMDNNVRNMLKDMPSARNLNKDQQKNLFAKTDERILELLKKAKKLGYEIESECITKLYVKKGLMELHLISGTSETSRTFREDNSQLGSNLYDFLDGNEGEYKTYLTNRVKQKRQELDSLTKSETTDVEKKPGKNGQENSNEDESKKENEQQHKQQVLYGIGLLETMVNNYRESEGDSWLDNDDRNLVQIKQLIRNAKASIANANAIDDEVITSSFINPIRQKWALIKRISKTINSGQGQTYENPSYKQQYNQLKKVFFGSNNEQIDAIRDLGGFGRLFDKTETSFLQQEIENNSFNEEGENLEVKYTKVNECIQKIYNYKVELSQEAGDFDESGNLSPAGQEKVKELDNLYEKAKLEKSEFANYLSSIGLLPPNWKTKNKMVLKAVESLQNKLNNTQKQLDNFAKTKDNLSEEQHIKKLKLEQKENKTEEDLKELQALEYLEQNTEERDRINEVTLNMMKIDLKYGGINQLLGSSLFESLTELGGGAVGNNSKVYNDIIGYGFRNASDENAKLAGEIATEIAITVAVCVVTGGAGAGAIAAMLNVGSKAARATKWVRLANNIQKLVRLNNLGMKGFRIANTAGKISMLTTHAAGLLIEGTVFNAATNTIHSAMNGTSLDSLNLNPTAKENVQTAAFLGALSISGRLTQGLMKAGGKTKLSINLMKGLEKAHLQAPAKFTTGLVTEMGSMLAAEQTINFVFGHDIVNPETGEIEKSRKPELPTQQELTQMIGMILAFKMVKPGLWQQYTQKLNEGTLEICRSVKANEILVRNPKTGEIVERINQDSINGNNKETETKSVTEKPKDSPTKDREAIRKRQEELMNKKQSHEKRKAELNKRKAELERRKSEILAQREANWRSLDGRENNIGRIQDVLKKGHIITIDGLKYKFNGIKNGKAEFIIDGNAKKSAETSGKSYSEKVEVSSLEELLSSHFNLEPGNKGTNSGRYAKLNELIGEKVEPLDRLQNKIRNKKAEIKTLEEEIARLEKGNNTIAKNDYFEQHKNEIIGKNVRIDGVKYRAEQINKDGTIQFKEVDGSDHFTVSSFKQLAEKGQVNGFSDGLKRTYDGKEVKREKIEGSESLKEGERKNHEIIRNLISGESEYLSSRNMDQTINQKRTELQSTQQELKGLEDKLPASQTRQQAISERARRGEELNKELGKLETELNGVNRELGEADRLVKKYQDEIDGIEKELPTEQQPKEREVVKPDVEGNVSPESVQQTLTQKEILSESMGSDLHEEWRKGRLKEDGTYEPRIKETKDAEWISKNGTNQVDIANTKFEDLPSDWKYENLEAAKVAVDLVYEKILKGESISPKTLEEMSSKVHEERLKRNSWAKGGELDVPYDKLPEVEKAKDRNQVLQAIEKVGGKEKRVGIENLFNNYRKGLELKNIKDFDKAKEEGNRKQREKNGEPKGKNDIENANFTEEEINILNKMLDKYKDIEADNIPLEDRKKVLNIIKNKFDIKETEKKAAELKKHIEEFFESDLSNKIDTIDFGDYETTKNLVGRLTKFLERKYELPELKVTLHNQEAGRLGVHNKNEIHLNTNSREGNNNRDVLDFFVNIYSHEFCHTLDAYGKGSLNPQINELGTRFYIKSGDYYYNNPIEIVAHRTGEIVSGKKGYGFDGSQIIGERFSEMIKKSLTKEIDKMQLEDSTNSKQREKQDKKQREEQQKRQREGNFSNEIRDEIKNKVPDILAKEQKLSIISEFSNNPKLQQNFIKTKVIKNLFNYVENITKSGRNPDLIEALRGSKEELSNIPYKERIELINNINSYLKSVETASKFISIEKSGGVSAKELFLRAKGLDVSEIKNFEGNVTIEQFRNSIVFVFEKTSDVQRFFKKNGAGNHFENKIPGLDTIVINKEDCKNAEKIGLKEEDAISRTLQHESQHAINEIFMPKNTNKNILEDALNRVKNEIVAQYTSRIIFSKLSPETIAELSKRGGIKETLLNPPKDGHYDYFGDRKNTPEGKKAREEYKKEVEKMCDYIDETLKSCKSKEEIQDMLNMFCTTDVKERKNIKDTVKAKEQQRREKEEKQKREGEEQERKLKEEQDNLDIDVQVLSSSITESQLNTLRSLNKGKNERIYLDEFGEPKNVISLGNGENLYISDCLELNGRKFIVGYVQKGGEMKLRLFYRSNSEGARRSCPGERTEWIDAKGKKRGGGYSKGEGITNSSYETTTRVINELQYEFDSLPTETVYFDPISMKGKGVGYNILEREMASEIKIDKLFNGLNNNTVDYIKGHTVAEVKDMYRRLGVGIDTSGMKIVEGKGYTYEHQYLGTIEVKVCRLNYNGKDLDFSFSKVKNDPQNRVRIEEVNYADAKVSSFGIYDKQINAAPLTGKPIDYANERHWQVPKDQNGTRYGGTYMDIRDLYQENPIIKRFKELSQIDNTYTSAA